MAAVQLHNVLFTPASPPAMSFSSRSSIATSGATSSFDMLSNRPFVNSQQTPSAVYPQSKPPGTKDEPFRRSSKIWFYAMLCLSFALLLWVTYCTVRYFVALRVYREDALRSRYALGMGVTSTCTILFFAVKSVSMLRLCRGYFRHRLLLIFHSLTYFSSALVMSLAVINLVLVLRWRIPHSPAEYGRSIQGRCNWDLDIIWSGTGRACSARDAMPFGDWLGAAIFRVVITTVLLAANHLATHGYIAAQQSRAALPVMIFAGGEEDGHVTLTSSTLRNHRPSRRFQEPHGPQIVDSVKPEAAYDAELPPRPLSFTEAGQVLSRIEGSEGDDQVDQELFSSSDSIEEYEGDFRPQSVNHRISFPRSDSPEPFYNNEIRQRPSHTDGHYTGLGSLPRNPPPSSYHRPIASSSSDLQDFASAFRSLVSRISHDTQEGMTLDEPSIRRRENDRVHMFGSYISRMSTIESMASREVSDPSRSDTGPSGASDNSSPPSSHPASRNLSRNPTLNRGRDKEEVSEAPQHTLPSDSEGG